MKNNMKIIFYIRFALGVVIPLFLISCDNEERRTEPYIYTELAMQENMVIQASNKNGSVSIKYVSPLERCYKWDNYSECRTLIPRKDRFYGKLGAYDPATTYFWEFYKTRIVAEDSQLNFKNREELKAWLYQGVDVFDWVYTDDGLVVGFVKSPDRNQVNIEVYQLLINNKKPNRIDGSRSEKIKVFFQND